MARDKKGRFVKKTPVDYAVEQALAVLRAYSRVPDVQTPTPLVQMSGARRAVRILEKSCG